MSTVQAFNTMLKTFLEELAAVFPEEAQVAAFLQTFDTLVALDPRRALDTFTGAIAPHAQLAMARDPALFEHLSPGGINFKRMWDSDISDATRDAIWQHLNLLLLLGTTVQAMPPDMLQSIETVAKNCAEQVESGDLDFSKLGSMLAGGGLGGAGGLANLAGLGNLGGLAALAGNLALDGGDVDMDDGLGNGDGGQHRPARPRGAKPKRKRRH